MTDRSRQDQRTIRNRLIWEDASAWIGRIFAIMLFMIGPGAAGVWLDRLWGTKFLAAIGFVVGMVLGTAALLVLVNIKRPSLDDEVANALDETKQSSEAKQSS
jgi:hypothetical protein